jgi:hypothetical protein
MVVKIFVKRCRYHVFDSRFYRMRGETCAQPFRETLYTAAIVARMTQSLSDPRLHGYFARCKLIECGLLPTSSIRVRIATWRLRGGKGSRQRHYRQNELGKPSHTNISAIS